MTSRFRQLPVNLRQSRTDSTSLSIVFSSSPASPALRMKRATSRNGCTRSAPTTPLRRLPCGADTLRRWRSCGTRAGTSQAPAAFRSIPSAALALVRLRLRDAGGVVARRWAGAALAGTTAGALAGTLGGLLLFLSPDSSASLRASLALAALGALAGGLGAAGIGAGLAAAEALARSRRGLGLVLCGATAGLVVAVGADVVLRALVEGLVGHVELTGNSLAEGLVIGGTAGLGYALATRQPPGGGLAAPEGRRRVAAAGIVAAVVGAGAVGLALAGGSLVGGVINEIAGSSPDAQLALAPLGRLIGEPDFGRVTRALLSALEGGAFGFALAWGLTARPRR